MKYSQKAKLLSGISIAVGISILALFLDLTGLSEIFERKAIDLRTRICREAKALPSDIVIIMVDEASLNDLNSIAGRWPWPRHIHAELIDFLRQSNARAIIMDIMFLENELDSGAPDTRLGQHDLKLVESTQAAKNVFHAVQIIHDDMEIRKDLINKPMPTEFTDQFSLDVAAMTNTRLHNIHYLPFKELYRVSAGIGTVSCTDDKDGVFRSERLLFNYQNNFFPSLSIAPIVDQFKGSKIILKTGSVEIVNPEFVISIPLTKNNEYYVNMYGRYGEDAIYSYSRVYQTQQKIKQGDSGNLPVNPDIFDDKIVFVGASAAATADLKHTSIGTQTPGVFLHASVCGNILENDFLRLTHPVINLISLLVLIFITVFSIFYLKTLVTQVLMPLAALAVFYLTNLLAFRYNIVLNMSLPSFAVLSAYFASYAYLSFTEGKEKKKITNILGQYVSPAMLSTVLLSSKDQYLKAEVGTKETLTIFFSDIRSFTTISEKYEVEKVVEVLNAYLSEMVNIIFNNKGTLDKFIGDAVVAFWGAPVRLQDQHYKAVLSAIQMIEALGPFNLKNREKDLPEFKIGVGIHTGEVILGNIGSEKKLDYTVIGDSVNLTSRLEGLSKFYKCSILISQDTYEHIQDKICCRIADYVKVKGKDKPIMIYGVSGEIDTVSREDTEIADLTQKAFDLYRKKSFKESITVLEKITTVRPGDHLAELFIDRCSRYITDSPPQDWDGSYSHETK